MLKDGCGRELTYLRISLTDKCNLRCRYCVPPEGVKMLDHADVLSLEEILRVTTVLTNLGISKVRFTGGEPLVRKNAVSLIRNVASLSSRPSIRLTTNGVMLNSYLPELLDAGVRDINISIDTLREDVYEKITGMRALNDVLEGAASCLKAGVRLKFNAVPIKGINEDDLIDLAGLAREEEVAVRFIELMPVGCASCCEGIPNDEVRKRISSVYGEEIPVDQGYLPGPAEYVTYEGFKGRVGFISPMTHSFCSSCNRLRLTCDGKLKLCLASPECLDLRKLLRSGASDEDIAGAIREAVMRKPASHGLKFTDDRNMIGIGG